MNSLFLLNKVLSVVCMAGRKCNIATKYYVFIQFDKKLAYFHSVVILLTLENPIKLPYIVQYSAVNIQSLSVSQRC